MGVTRKRVFRGVQEFGGAGDSAGKKQRCVTDVKSRRSHPGQPRLDCRRRFFDVRSAVIARSSVDQAPPEHEAVALTDATVDVRVGYTETLRRKAGGYARCRQGFQALLKPVGFGMHVAESRGF